MKKQVNSSERLIKILFIDWKTETALVELKIFNTVVGKQ